MEVVNAWDRYVFLFVNQSQANAIDPLMMLLSNRYTWVPFYLLLVGLIYWVFRENALSIVLVIGLTVTLTDLLIARGLKPFFGRLRPCLMPELEGHIHLLGTCEGPFGLPSAHAANSFALTHFIWLLFRCRVRWLGWIYLCPLAIGYSRIYLGVHYPGDVLTGALLGLGVSTVFYIVISRSLDGVPPLIERPFR